MGRDGIRMYGVALVNRFVDLRKLGYFLSIAEHGGFAAAARARYVSQSALTGLIKLLEEEILGPCAGAGRHQ